MRISFGVLVNNIQRLDMVFNRSQFPSDTLAFFVKNPETATKGLNILLNHIESREEDVDVAVLVHADMYFRHDWLELVKLRLQELPSSWVVAGVIGKDLDGRICGKLHDMRVPHQFDTSGIHSFPQSASCFDECVIFVNMRSGFRFEELEGFDLYGTLAVLQAREMGGTAWIIDAFCEHYCMRSFDWVPDDTFISNFKWLYDRFSYIGRVDSTAIGLSEGVDTINIITGG